MNVSTNDKVEPKISNDAPEKSIFDELNEPDQNEAGTEYIPEEVAEVPRTGSASFKMFFSKENRWVLIFGSIILVVVIGALSLVFYQFNKPKQRMEDKAGDVATSNKTQPKGELSALRAEEVAKANEEIRNSDTFGYEIAPEGEMKDESAIDSEKDKPKCDDSDTACYRIEGLVKADECAPKDSKCIEAKQKSSNAENLTSNVKGIKDPNQVYMDRLNNPEYKKNLAKEFNKIAKEYSDAPVEFGEDIAKKKPPVVVEVQGEAENSNTGKIKTDSVPGAIQNTKLVELYHNAGDRSFAVADIALNSKIQGPVSLTVFDEVFGESVAIGKAVRVDDYMRLELNNLVLPDDRECSIQAIALDSETTYAAIASRVDHHVLYRYGWWGLGAALEVIGTAAQLGAKETTTVSDGVVIETTESTAKEEALMALGGLGKEIGRVMAKRIDTPSTVYVDKDEQMGFFFLKRVTSEDCR